MTRLRLALVALVAAGVTAALAWGSAILVRQDRASAPTVVSSPSSDLCVQVGFGGVVAEGDGSPSPEEAVRALRQVVAPSGGLSSAERRADPQRAAYWDMLVRIRVEPGSSARTSTWVSRADDGTDLGRLRLTQDADGLWSLLEVSWLGPCSAP